MNRDAPSMDDLLKARLSIGHLLHDTHPLSAQDYELIGAFVQTYCVADLESRRVINCLSHIRLGEPTEFALRLNDKDTLEHLVACADSCTWNSDLSVGLRRVAEIFVQHRQIRHMFAHWAGRKIPSHDALIFFTTSMDKQKMPIGSTIFESSDDANLRYGLMPRPAVVEELDKLVGHAKYLGAIAAELESKAPQIAEQFTQDVASGKIPLRPYRVAGGRA